MTFIKRTFSLLFVFFVSANLFAQVNKQVDAAKIYEQMLRLQNTATVMYLAAHPDDENTRLISWLSNEKHVNTVYLSLTRGDGGQNLIGTEKGPLLGLLRTQELLQARSVDGGKQFFSRANDFGFSKTATETRSIWEEDEIMSDIVWAIRKFQPDVIINRFDANTNGKTHGHHTFSAQASLEAFDLAGDATKFSEQLNLVKPWQPKRVFFNTSWWFYGSKEAFEKADKSNMLAINIGEYYPVLGISNNEIAAKSRSMHRCQGFGTEAIRGTEMEYLEFLKGDKPNNDLLDGINQRFSRYTGNDDLDNRIQILINQFDFKNPSASIAMLLDVRKLINNLSDKTIKERKLAEINQLIKWCAGFYIEATAANEIVVPGDSLALNIELVNRSVANAKLLKATYLPSNYVLASNTALANNESVKLTKSVQIPTNAALSSPYWLNEKQKNMGMYIVENQALRGLPETPKNQQILFEIDLNGEKLQFVENINYKEVNPAVGEIYQPLIIAEPVTVNLNSPVYISVNGKELDISVELKSFIDNAKGNVSLQIDKNWTIQSNAKPFSIAKKGDKQIVHFKVIPPKGESVATLSAYATVNGKTYSKSITTVDYEHIPKQTVFMPTEAVIENLAIQIPPMQVGYIKGAGDLIPESLEQLGINVEQIDINNATQKDLEKYTAIIVGIRAFNILNEMDFFKDKLWKYAENGGNVVVQYNTNRGIKTDIAPLKINLTKDRITEEDATLKMINTTHGALNYPNKITESDFDNWVQERGLYFADEWDSKFVPLLEGHDTGETDKKGMLLIAPYRKGNYVYTGISFFRQLPAGVPGTYRLFINLLALKQN
ncbi:MAG: PIG-L family deacetylase [Chitinophagales bacterium]